MSRNDERIIVVSPLEKARFVPDVVLAYCGNITQVRDLIAGSKEEAVN